LGAFLALGTQWYISQFTGAGLLPQAMDQLPLLLRLLFPHLWINLLYWCWTFPSSG